MESIKLFFEEGRTTIVIDNPSSKMNEALKERFESNVNDIVSLLAPCEEKPITPQGAPVVVKSQPAPNETEEDAAYHLLNDVAKQHAIGLDETIRIFAKGLHQPIDRVNNFLSAASGKEKVERYHFLIRVLNQKLENAR